MKLTFSWRKLQYAKIPHMIIYGVDGRCLSLEFVDDGSAQEYEDVRRIGRSTEGGRGREQDVAGDKNGREFIYAPPARTRRE